MNRHHQDREGEGDGNETQAQSHAVDDTFQNKRDPRPTWEPAGPQVEERTPVSGHLTKVTKTREPDALGEDKEGQHVKHESHVAKVSNRELRDSSHNEDQQNKTQKVNGRRESSRTDKCTQLEDNHSKGMKPFHERIAPHILNIHNRQN